MPDSSPHSLPSVEECDERIAEAQHVLDHLDDFDPEVHVQADKDRRRWEFNRHFAERVASLEEQLEATEQRLARETYAGYPVRLSKDEARLLMKLLTMQVDYPDLDPEQQELYDKLERVL